MHFGYAQALSDREARGSRSGFDTEENLDKRNSNDDDDDDNDDDDDDEKSAMVAELSRQHCALSSKLEEACKAKSPAQPAAKHTVVFTHIPLFVRDVAEDVGGASLPLAARQMLLPLLAKCGVRAVFSGHLHFNVGEIGSAAAFARAAADAAGIARWKRRLESVSSTLWRMLWAAVAAAGLVASSSQALSRGKGKGDGENVAPPQGIAGTIRAEECAHISTSSVNPGHPSSIFAPLPLLPAMVTAIGDDSFVGETRSGLRIVKVFEDRLEHEFVSLE